MRIDGYSSYPLDRPTRPGSAVTPYRETQRTVEREREQQPAQAATQGYERQPQIRQVFAASSGADVPASYLDREAPGVPRQVAQALASYATTAAHQDIDANEVLGLDLYA